jgi:hypothetical protein
VLAKCALHESPSYSTYESLEGLDLDDLAAVWNPRNEYCGAQIRADALGIVSKSQNWLEAYRTIHERYGRNQYPHTHRSSNCQTQIT